MGELEQIYLNSLPIFDSISKKYEGVSRPLFISVPDNYYKTKVKLMIVGQQTNGWGDNRMGLDRLLQLYDEFNLAEKKYGGSPFWRYSHTLFKALNPAGPDRAFLWSNLIKVDQKKDRPESQIESEVATLRLLPEEIRLLKPDVVVFFTGPKYENCLQNTFANVKFRTISKCLSRVVHDNLPTHSYRTYHPGYLSFIKGSRVLDKIATEINI